MEHSRGPASLPPVIRAGLAAAAIVVAVIAIVVVLMVMIVIVVMIAVVIVVVIAVVIVVMMAVRVPGVSEAEPGAGAVMIVSLGEAAGAEGHGRYQKRKR